MDKRHRERRRGWRRLRRQSDDPETTSLYTPQEIQNLLPGPTNGSGVIRFETGHLPAPVDENDEPGTSPYRVLLIIISLALIFIAIITYFVIQMPKKD